MLWLAAWHCRLPLLAAQMTTSGAEDAAALREARTAADTSACTRKYTSDGWVDGCALDSWTADTEPCGDGYDSLCSGWYGVECDERGGQVVRVDLWATRVGGELLRFFGRLGALVHLRLGKNPALRGNVVADLADAAVYGKLNVTLLDLEGCPLVVGEAAALAALLHLREEP